MQRFLKSDIMGSLTSQYKLVTFDINNESNYCTRKKVCMEIPQGNFQSEMNSLTFPLYIFKNKVDKFLLAEIFFMFSIAFVNITCCSCAFFYFSR